MTGTDSAQEAAVDAMRVERARHDYYCPGGHKTLATCKCEWEAVTYAQAGYHDQIAQWERHVEESVLAVLLSPTKKPCAACKGSGIVCLCGAPRERPSAGVTKSCPECSGDGFVSSPAPIEGLLEQVGELVTGRGSHSGNLYPQLVPTGAHGILGAQYEVSRESVFRLPSKVREG